MTPQRAVELFLQSVDECKGVKPVPALPAELAIVCQGAARNRTLEAAK